MKRVEIISQFIEGNKILDLGSAGFDSNLHEDLLKETGKKIIGVDIVKNKQVQVVTDLNKRFPFKTNSIDTIIASEVIEHLECPFNLLRESYRILKKGGRLILSTPNPTGLPQIMERDNSHDILLFNRDQLTKSIEDVGFKIIEYIRPMEAYRYNLILKGISYLFPKSRITQYVVALK